MTKPQTLAEQIRALMMQTPSEYNYGWNAAMSRAAAIADAAATTPTEQAGDVGRAWRVKPLVWFEVEKSRYGGKYTADGYTIRYIEGRWLMDFGGHSKSIWNFSDLGAAQSAAQADYAARITAALEPDPTPALSWRAMQTAAAELMQSASAKCRENFTYPAKTKEQRDWQTGAIIHANAATALLALPGPTDAQLLAEALKLPEVQAMRTALQTLRGLMCEGFEDEDGNSGCGQCEDDCTGCVAHFALAKIGEAK
jgi:hypothetical protein